MGSGSQAFGQADISTVAFHYHHGAVTEVHAGHRIAWRRLASLVLSHIDGYDAVMELGGGRTVAIPSGHVICIRPWVSHQLTTHCVRAGISRWSHTAFTVHGDVDVFAFFAPPWVIGGDRAERIGDINEEISRLAGTAGGSWAGQLRHRALGLELLALVLECSAPRASTGPGANQLGRLSPALEFINTHLREALYIRDMAAACGMSPSRFHAAFRQGVGMAPGKFLQDLRLRKAQALLVSSDQPVKAVAAEVGYPDEFHFSRLFRARFGRSPSEHRRQARDHRM